MTDRRRETDSPIYLTVAEVLRLPELEGARLLTSPETAATRYAKSTSVQESLGGFEGFMRPDEFVMTTGIGLEGDEDHYARIVKAVADADASCLAVAVGPHVHGIPEWVVEAAESVNLPLVELPWGLRFSTVTEIVLGHVLSRQNELLRRSEQIHGLLTGIVLSRGHLDDVCEAVAHLLGRHVRIVDRWLETRAATTDTGRLGEVPPVEEMTATPIATATFELGTLYVGGSEAPFTALDHRTAQHGATAAALIMMTEMAVAQAEARGQREFLSGILSGLIGSPEDIARHSAVLGIDPRRSYAPVCLLFERSGASRDETVELARWALTRALGARHITALTAWYGLEVVLLLPVSQIPARQQMTHVLDDLGALLRRHGPRTTITGGIAAESAPLSTIAQGVREAVAACRLGHSFNRPGSLTDYAELGACPALLEASAGHNSVAAFRGLHERYLEPILKHEARSGMPLVETLMALFAHNGNVSATARALGINRQSLLYRIAKISSLCGADLASPSTRFALEVATRAHRLQGIAASSLPRTLAPDGVPASDAQGHREPDSIEYDVLPFDAGVLNG